MTPSPRRFNRSGARLSARLGLAERLAETEGSFMSIQLTEMQRSVLSTAARRNDRIVMMPHNLKGGAVKKLIEKFVEAGLAREVQAKNGMSIWRRDPLSNQTFALRLTAAGVKAAPRELAPPAVNGEEGSVGSNDGRAEDHAVSTAPSSEIAQPRNSSKIVRVIALLKRETGATIDEIIAETGWLPHTSRAALTGLRKRGFAIERRERLAGPRAYVVIASQQDAA